MDLLFNPTSKECKQLLLTSDVHEGPLPYIVNSVALCGGNVDWQHDIILHVLQDQVVDHNIHIVHHTPNQALYVTYKRINMRNRLKKANDQAVILTINMYKQICVYVYQYVYQSQQLI